LSDSSTHDSAFYAGHANSSKIISANNFKCFFRDLQSFFKIKNLKTFISDFGWYNADRSMEVNYVQRRVIHNIWKTLHPSGISKIRLTTSPVKKWTGYIPAMEDRIN